MAYLREQSSNWFNRGLKSYNVVIYVYKNHRKCFAIHAVNENEARIAVAEIEAAVDEKKEELLAANQKLEDHIKVLEDELMKQVKNYRLEPKRTRRKI